MPVAQRLTVVLTVMLLHSGCAIHYFDEETQTEHVWGIGHVPMSARGPVDDVDAVGRRLDVVGVSLSSVDDSPHLGVGWIAEQRLEIVNKNTQLCLAWPSGAFYAARVGSALPPNFRTCGEQ